MVISWPRVPHRAQRWLARRPTRYRHRELHLFDHRQQEPDPINLAACACAPGMPWTPERGLLEAILDQALWDLRRPLRSPQASRQALAAWRWLDDHERYDWGSAAMICDVLDLSVSAVRRAARSRAAEAVRHARGGRHQVHRRRPLVALALA